MRWNDEQLKRYRADGFILSRGLLSAQTLTALRSATPDLLNGDEAKDRIHREREKSGAVRQVFLAHRHSPPFRALTSNPLLLDPVKQILDSGVYVWHSKVNVKDAFEGSVWLWHQDYGYWMWDGVSPRMLSVLVMLDRTTLNNGCLLVVAGSHRGGRREHYADTVTTSYKQWCLDLPTLKELVSEEKIVPITGEPGDVLFFDPNLVHGSGHNMSPLPRNTYIVAYNSIENKPRPVENPRPDWVVSREFEVLR